MADRSCRSPLYLFQVVDVFVEVGVQDTGRVFESWTNHESVGSCLHRGGAITEVSADKSKSSVGIVYRIRDLLPPCEIFTDGKSQVFATVYYFQCLSMVLIAGIEYSSPAGVDPDYSTYLRVELHLPGCFPFLQSRHVEEGPNLALKSCVYTGENRRRRVWHPSVSSTPAGHL